MATRLPSSVGHPGVVGGQPSEAPCSNNNGKVLISVDDTALLHSPMESLRARSLNRLDSFDDGDPGVDIYRCPSFPRLQKRCNSQIDSSQTNCSMTHLETNSISPRVSTDNLTNITRDDSDSRERLLLGGYAGLVRSVSSKTVDELPPLELPVNQFERLGHNYLSPSQMAPDKIPQPVSRSTSCPSMAYTRRSPSPHPIKASAPRDPERRDEAGAGLTVDWKPAEVSRTTGGGGRLEGHDARDLDRTDEGQKVNSACEEHPMHTKRLLEKQRDRLSLIKQNGELYRNRQFSFEGRQPADQQATKEGHYVNIGDIPSAVAEKVMDKTSGSSRAVHTVQKKCLQWLNSLDNDDSS